MTIKRLSAVNLTIAQQDNLAVARVVPDTETDAFASRKANLRFAAELAARWNLLPDALAVLRALREDLETDYISNPSVRAANRRGKHLAAVSGVLDRAEGWRNG